MSKAIRALLAGFVVAAIAAPLAQADVGRPTDVGRMNPWASRDAIRGHVQHARPAHVTRMLPWASRGIAAY
jgi:hypothetical protein